MFEVEIAARKFAEMRKIKAGSKMESEVIHAFITAYRMAEQKQPAKTTYEPAPFWTNPDWQAPKVTC